MSVKSSSRGPKAKTLIGLVMGALGIAILWASGVAFVALARWPWAPAVGAFLGLFVTIGFLISPTGWSNLTGEAGASVAIGQTIQVIGVLTVVMAGVVATRANYRKPDRARVRDGRAERQ